MSRARIFDVFNFKYYEGANPYLPKAATVFDLIVSPIDSLPTPDEYLSAIRDGLDRDFQGKVSDYTELFVITLVEINRLEMDLYLKEYSIRPRKEGARIAIECLDKFTTYEAIEVVSDWLEAIARDEKFNIHREIRRLQSYFRRSTYGGPTVYALLETARARSIPTFYLPEERVMQYGYCKYGVRGVATTFDTDSQLDSDFTTQKDDCKAFLDSFGFPVPKGRIVYTLTEALDAIDIIGYPVAVKPVVGHKGIGVTADIRDDKALEFAFLKAKEALNRGHTAIIVERSIKGSDYRLLCVGGRFVAAVERRPPHIIGDGISTVEELIDRENATPERRDTPTSPLGKIILDEVMESYLSEQDLTLNSVVEKGELIYLRKVANISLGGVSVDVTESVHPDNKILAGDIAGYFNLVCLGIDVIAGDISRSWREGDFGILEINAAPGVSMHLNPAIGKSVDVPHYILDRLFPSPSPCRIPIVTFNRLYREDIFAIVTAILSHRPELTIGSICHEGLWWNYAPKSLSSDYNKSVKSLLRHKNFDFLLVEYGEELLDLRGMAYSGSDTVILKDPTDIEERVLTENLLPGGTSLVKRGQHINRTVENAIESYDLVTGSSFQDVYLREFILLLDKIP